MNPLWLGSPNYSVLPGRRVLGIVLHSSEGTLAGMVAVFHTPGAASAHYAIAVTGQRYQLVRDGDVAYHVAAFGANPALNRNRPNWLLAGNGLYSAVNQYTIGVELEGYAATGFTAAQYAELGRLVAETAETYHFPPLLEPDYGANARILTHGWLQTDRSDPGGLFDWTRLRAAINAAANATPEQEEADVARIAELEAALASVTYERDQYGGINTELQRQVDSLTWLLGLAQGERDAEATEAARLRDLVDAGDALTPEDADKLARYARIRELVAA